MSESVQIGLAVLDCLMIPVFFGGIKFIIRVEKKLARIEAKLGINED